MKVIYHTKYNCKVSSLICEIWYFILVNIQFVLIENILFETVVVRKQYKSWGASDGHGLAASAQSQQCY